MSFDFPKQIDGEATAAKLMKVVLRKAEESVEKEGGDADDVLRSALFSLSYLAVKLATNSGNANQVVLNPYLFNIVPTTIIDSALAKL